MATQDRTAKKSNQGVRSIGASATQRDIHEELLARQAQLSAILAVATEGNGVLTHIDQTEAQNFLWACEWIAKECLELAAAIRPAQR